MYYNKKLKPPLISTEMIIGIVVSVVFLFLVSLSYFLAMGFGALITFFAAILTLIVYLRMRNIYFLVSLFAHLFATAFLALIAFNGFEEHRLIAIILAGIMLVFQTLMIIFTFQKKMKWRSREVLEMAASPVADLSNGFTGRPLIAGTANYSAQELHGFNSFIQKNLIAIAVAEKDRVIFIINMPWSAMITFSKRYLDRSYVAFDHDGNVSVSICQQDYFLYHDRLAFDQLCLSLGKLFIEFMEQYQSGDTVGIIDRFNALKLNIITEG